MSVPLATPGWRVVATTTTLDAHRTPVRSRTPAAGDDRGPYDGKASYTTAVQEARGQVAGWTVNLQPEAWPIAPGAELLAPDGITRYRVGTAVLLPGAAGGSLGHVHCTVDLVTSG